MTITRFISALGGLFALLIATACTTPIGSLDYGNDARYGMPSQHVLGSEDTVLEHKLNEVIAKLDFEPLEGTQVDARVKRTVLDSETVIDLNITWTTNKAFFPLGVHDVRRVVQYENQELLEFMEYLVGFVHLFKAELEEMGHYDFEILAEYTGSADGVPIKSSGIRYQGEYGLVAVDADFMGRDATFYIEKGDLVSNAELALLRAVSLNLTMKSLLGADIETVDSYTVRTYGTRGSNYRSANVTFRLRSPLTASTDEFPELH